MILYFHLSSPRDDNDEVHDIPAGTQVGALVHDEAKGNDLQAALDAENDHENGLRLLQLFR